MSYGSRLARLVRSNSRVHVFNEARVRSLASSSSSSNESSQSTRNLQTQNAEHSSKKAQNAQVDGAVLSEKKLRGLVELYNYSSAFITTEEELEKHIDREFGQVDDGVFSPSRDRLRIPIKAAQLQNQVEDRRAQPALISAGAWETELLFGRGLSKGTNETQGRQRELISAFWGVHDGNPTLEAAYERVEDREGGEEDK